MDKSLLRKAAIQSLALMIAVVTLSYGMKHYQTITIAASSLFSDDSVNTKALTIPEDAAISIENVQTGQIEFVQKEQLEPAQTEQIESAMEEKLVEVDLNAPITSIDSLKSRVDNNLLQKLSENFLVIKKPAGNSQIMQLEDIYINHSIQLDLTGLAEDNVNSSMVFRIRGNDLYVGNPEYTEIITQETDEEKGTTEEVITKDFGKDLCHGITITTQETEEKQYKAQILIELDSVYEYIIYQDAAYYYIDLKKPSEVYDKIIVIDPGHGGKDAGAVSKNKKYYEKDINLGIALQLKELLEQENIKVYYTRTADDKVFLRPRSTLANSVDCDYFISIHCNSNSVSSPNGSEVLYYNTDFKGVKSSELANLFVDELAKTITLKQKGTVQRHFEDIFIMDQAKVPMVLIEVGYLSNRRDLDYLTKLENQKAVAQGIFNSIMRAYQELPVTE